MDLKVTEALTNNKPLSILDRPLASLVNLDAEKVILICLLLIAVVTRFWDLGARSYNHDESIHTHYAFSLYTGKGYAHNPIYHGPLLYHLTALTFFLFGDNDVTGRVPNVVMGLVILTLPYFFRKWLGKRGWFITAFLLLISPAVTYYSRFNRHDVYVEVFVLLMLLSIMKFLETRRDIWLYASATSLALSFTAMETTFIFVALFGYALTSLFTIQWLNKNEDIEWPSALKTLAGVFLGMPFFAYFAGYMLYERLFKRTPETELGTAAYPAFDLGVLYGTFTLPFTVTPLVLKFVLKLDPASVPGSFNDGLPYALTLLVVTLIAAFIGVSWSARRWTVAALIFVPIILVLFTTVFTNLGGVFSGVIGSLGYWLSQQDVARGGQPWYYYIAVELPYYEFLPYLFGIIGMLWVMRSRGFERALLAFTWPILIFTIWLIFSATVPPPDWLSKGMLPLVLVILPFVAFAAYDDREPSHPFQFFVFIWIIGDLIFFSWAGEKMPWLTMHLTISLAFGTGIFMDRVLETDWAGLYRRGAHWFVLLFIVGFFILAMQLFFGPQNLGTAADLEKLNRTLTTLFSFIALAAIVLGLYWFGSKVGLFQSVRLLVVGVFVLLAAFTIHSNALASYYYSDVATELIIYAQGSPDVPIAMREIEGLSRRLCAQIPQEGKKTINCDNGTIKVAYDDDSSWPFVWYLRNYRNQQYYGKSPNSPFDAEVVIVGNNEQAIKPLLGNRYLRREMKLIWWPLENYKDLTWARLLGGKSPTGEEIKPILSWENMKYTFRDIWFFHQYQESLSNWPYRHTFAMYIRKDVAANLWDYSAVTNPADLGSEDDYTKKFLPNVNAQTVFGTLGNLPGQLNNPRAIALDAAGNMYVADSGNLRIEKFDPTGKFLMQIGGGAGTGAGQFADGPGGSPWGIAIDKDGNIYAADTWNHRIQKFDKNGRFLLAFGHPYDPNKPVVLPTDDLTAFFGPRAIAIDSDGNLLITDTGNKRVVKYSPTGEALAGYGGAGGEPGQFLEPVGISTDQQGSVYIADTWNQRIQKLDRNFNPVAQWSISAWDNQSVLTKPFIAVDNVGSIFITDPENFRVIKYGSDGKVLGVFGSKGNDLGNFDIPTGITIDSNGNLYVVDSGNSRVMIFSPIK